MGDRLRPLWDFDDLEVTEGRFRAQLERETDDAGRAEVLTQLARVEGLRGRFAEGEQLLREAESLDGTTARVELERGRLLRSSGDVEAARSLFVAAFEAAAEASIAADAAHMAALVAHDSEEFERWTQRGLEIAEASDDPGVRYWCGPLLNNLGCAYHDAGLYEQALDAFERALAAYTRDGTEEHVRRAKDSVAEARTALASHDTARTRF